MKSPERVPASYNCQTVGDRFPIQLVITIENRYPLALTVGNRFLLDMTVGYTFVLVITVGNTYSLVKNLENNFPPLITAGKLNGSSCFLTSVTHLKCHLWATIEMLSMDNRNWTASFHTLYFNLV